jgi:hypothetical protein
VRMADNLPPSSVYVTESGSLNLQESSGPHRPVMGLFTLKLIIRHIKAVEEQLTQVWTGGH